MSKKCSTCGTPAPDDNSVFCNRCGARLPAAGPADVLTCRKCGNPVTDRQSRFCDRCGSPLVPAVHVAALPVTPGKRKVCPGCGFENFGEDLFYCKKCGAIFPKNEPIPENRAAEKTSARRPHDGPIRIIPDGMDALRHGPVNAPAAARQPPGDAPVAIRRPPAKVTGAAQVLPRKPRQGVPKKRDRQSNRKVAVVAAGIILIILLIAVIAVSIPGIFNGGSANATASNATAPGLFEALSWGVSPNQTPVINEATPVVTDTPLTPTVT